MALKTKDVYKKGDKVKYTIEYGASPMLAKSKADKSKEKVGYVSKVTKDFTGKPQYVINNITIGHSSVLGLAESKINEAKYFSVVAIKNNKVVDQMHTVGENEIKDVVSVMKKDNPGATISVENSGGQVIKVYKENKQQGESKMKITKRELVEMIKTVVKEETEYQTFFKGALDKFGVSSPGEMDDAKKKEFFDYIEKNWTKETNETLEPVSPAAGNPLKRVKAKKRDQILAQEKVENYVRKIIREELRFVMFNEVPGGTSRKVAKKRISQTGSTDKSL